MRGPYWVHIDFGSDHRVKRADELPEGDWHGPFRTFGEARRFILSVGAAEAQAIHDLNGWWRSIRMDKVLEHDG